jgi:hypothetical protein
MGTEAYPKKGQVSAKPHATKKCGTEVYKDSKYDPVPAFGGGPDAYERRYMNDYRKRGKS